MSDNYNTIIGNLNEPDFKGYYVAALTDEYRIGLWPIEDGFDIEKCEEKILELRIFNTSVEYKWCRGSIGEDFAFRKLADGSDDYEEAIVEKQLLDIDMTKTKIGDLPGMVRMSKGGSFYCPLDSTSFAGGRKPCVIIKYYIPKYKDDDSSTVHAYVKDWRLSGFEGMK